MLHLIWFYCRLLVKGEVQFPCPPPSPCSSTEQLHRMSQISFLIWPKNTGIFGGLAILTIHWADPKDTNHSVATQLLHAIQRRHKAGKEGEEPEPSLSAVAYSWIGEVYMKLLPKAVFPWQLKSSQFPLSPSQLNVTADLAWDSSLRWPYTPSWWKINPIEKKSLPFPFFPHSSPPPWF